MSQYPPEKNLCPFFVYGTLMEGFYNSDRVLAGKPRKRQPARVQGRLFHLCGKGYPALVPGEGWVKGELFTRDDCVEVLPLLDATENYRPGGSDNEYNRVLTPVYPEDGSGPVEAYVYWYVDTAFEHTGQVEAIPDGDWRAFMENNTP